MADTSASGIAHVVFFTLNNSTADRQQMLIDDCRKYLAKQPGVVHFSVGSRGEEFNREVNDSEFHVALVVVFDSKESHDAYQTHPDHLEFIELNKANWARVRVFDARV